MYIILHLDMNSYFASVEQQANPHLRGRPVGVCEHLGGLIIAPSVEAKRLGIKLGTPVWEALKIAPQIVLLPTDPPKYRAISERFNRILADYSDRIERYSIDESFIDLTETCGGSFDDALLVGLAIKQRLRREVGEWVSCSIGIGPNKLVAKIAADLDGGIQNSSQPPLWKRGGAAPSPKVREGRGELLDRICVIRPRDVEFLYSRLKLTDIPGIGKRLERSLNKLGVYTLRQLADYSLANLLNRFGILGYVLHQLGNLNSSQPPLCRKDLPKGEKRGGVPSLLQREGKGEFFPADLPKSFGHAYTLPWAIRIGGIGGIGEIKKLMLKLSEKVGRRMRAAGARGRVVHYFDSFFHEQKTLPEPVSDGAEIYRVAWGMFQNSSPPPLFYKERVGVSSGIKIMGVTVSGLLFSEPPEPLFAECKKPQLMVAAMDRINDKYGELTLRRARLLGAPEEWGKDTVGFGRMRS